MMTVLMFCPSMVSIVIIYNEAIATPKSYQHNHIIALAYNLITGRQYLSGVKMDRNAMFQALSRLKKDRKEMIHTTQQLINQNNIFYQAKIMKIQDLVSQNLIINAQSQIPQPRNIVKPLSPLPMPKTSIIRASSKDLLNYKPSQMQQTPEYPSQKPRSKKTSPRQKQKPHRALHH